MSDVFAGFQRAEVEGIPVLWLLDRRFKTFRVTLHARRPLDERAAARWILPALLLQGTARDPDRPSLARRMEGLYGAAVVPWTTKMGESQVLRFSLDSVAGQHVPDQPDLFGEGLEFLSDLVSRPRLEEGGFSADVFRREQVQAAHSARSIFNDKALYAGERAIAHACEGEPMAIPEHGGAAAIESLQAHHPEEARRDTLMRGQMWVLAHGAIPEDGAVEQIQKLVSELPARAPEDVAPPVQPAPRERSSTVERAHIQQSKQVLVLRAPWTEDSRVWAARVLFASMLGGGPHSRLFRIVREERSLAYYAQASFDRHKGLLQVHTGLDEAAAEQVEEEVMRQFAALQAGEFSPQELDTARAGVLSALASVSDGIAERLEFTSRQWLLGQDRTPEQHAAMYAELGAADVAAALEGAWLDHSYLLAPEPGEGSAPQRGDA